MESIDIPLSIKEQCRHLLAAKQSLLQRLQASISVPVICDSDDTAYTTFSQIIDEWTVRFRSRSRTEDESCSEDVNQSISQQLFRETKKFKTTSNNFFVINSDE